jgi:bifunctional enzyme CysN/CysC/sulfate adenylyltransferase subunit 1
MAAPIVEPNPSSFLPAALPAAQGNLLRFTTAGSVDDGKSTLIGRLLYDSQAIYEDQLASVKKSRINRSTGPIDFSLLTDGLRAEREQGITIDVAYRYFSTPRRKFIIADTPGHEQYTRNMATGASTADAAIVLIDATKGVLVQSRRHAYIASLLGIRHVVAAINKMDLVGYSQEVFERLAGDFDQLAEKLGLASVYAVPISALEGDNVVRRSSRMAWFDGPSLLAHLEELPNGADRTDDAVRLPVQYVIRPDQNFRGFAGQLASGTLRVGDEVTVLPSRAKTRIRSIVSFDGDLEEARAGNSITVTLEEEVDISRGDMLVAENHAPAVSRHLRSKLVWMHPEPLDRQKLYLLKHTTRTLRARVTKIHYRVDVHSLGHHPAPTLQMNDIGEVDLETTLPVFFDPYQVLPATGSFILIDPISNATVAAGMIAGIADERQKSLEEDERTTEVTPQERSERFGHSAAAVLVVNRPEVATHIERTLFNEGWNVVQIDIDDSTERELTAVVRTLRFAGIVGVFVASFPKHRRMLAEIFDEAFFEVGDDQPGHEAATQLAARIRDWREESTR